MPLIRLLAARLDCHLQHGRLNVKQAYLIPLRLYFRCVVTGIFLLFFVLPMRLGAVESVVNTAKQSGYLGAAYDSEREEFVGLNCVTGKMQPTGSAEAAFALDQNLAQTQIANELGFAIGARARYGIYEGGLAADFLSRSTASRYSIVSAYKSAYSFPVEKLVSASLSQLGNEAKISGHWTTVCGNQFVSEIIKGAKLFVSISIDFSSDANKADFSAGFSIAGPMANVSSTLKKASQSVQQDARITISAYQLGGDVSQLTKVFGDQDAVKFYVQCTFGTIASCASVLENMVVYATDTQNGFPAQLHPGATPGPAVLEYGILPYENAGIFAAPYPGLSEVAGLARSELASHFEDNYTLLLAARRVLGSPLSKEMRSAIQESMDVAQSNIEQILPVSKLCYEHVDECHKAVKNLRLNSLSNLFFGGDSFHDYCLLAGKLGNGSDLYAALALVVVAATGQYLDASLLDEAACTKIGTTISKRRGLKITSLDGRRLGDNLYLIKEFDLVTLDVSRQDVGDLTPLERMTNMRRLYFSGNRVTDIAPLKRMNYLEELYMSENMIADLSPLSNKTRLDWIEANQNDIADLSPLSAARRLKRLDLYDNNISDLSALKSLPQLFVLDLRNNPLSEDQVKGLISSHEHKYMFSCGLGIGDEKTCIGNNYIETKFR